MRQQKLEGRIVTRKAEAERHQRLIAHIESIIERARASTLMDAEYDAYLIEDLFKCEPIKVKLPPNEWGELPQQGANPDWKRILLDIDGVICEYDFPRIVKDFFGVDLSSQMIFAYDLADVLGVAPALINLMFEKQVYGKPNFIDSSLDILREWKSKGYELVIYSNRVKYMGEIGLARWLIDNDIPFSGIDVPGIGTYDYHIDDSPGKLAATNSTVKLLYSQKWNEGCLDIQKQFTRVYEWNEIKRIVG